MACRLYGAKAVSELILVMWDLVIYVIGILFEMQFASENDIENIICEMATILFRPQRVDIIYIYIYI